MNPMIADPFDVEVLALDSPGRLRVLEECSATIHGARTLTELRQAVFHAWMRCVLVEDSAASIWASLYLAVCDRITVHRMTAGLVLDAD